MRHLACSSNPYAVPPTAARARRAGGPIICAVAILFCSATTPLVGQPVDHGGYRPHYQGYGVETSGGRRGVVQRVTTLADDGPGSLRAALAGRGPRFVVFEVSGTIVVRTPLVIDQPFVTVAGQSAPSPGVTVRGPGIIIDTHDVVLQHLRIRVGNLPHEPHGLWLRDDAHRVVIDHVSVSWAIWDAVAVHAGRPGHPVGDVTLIDSLFYESLACSGVNSSVLCDPAEYPQRGDPNSRGVLIGDGWNHPAPRVALVRNVIASINDRHPEIAGRTQTVIVNNLIYNPSLAPLAAIVYHDGFRKGPSLSIAAGNLLVRGPTTPGHEGYRAVRYAEEGEVMLVRIHPGLDGASRIFLEGNYDAEHCPGLTCLDTPERQWMLARDFKMDWEQVSVRAATPPFAIANLPLDSLLPYTAVERVLRAGAGARPRDRDVADSRILDEVAARTGWVPNTTAEKAGPGTTADGFPILAERTRALQIPTRPHDVGDAVGRTRIEVWLEAMAQALEPAAPLAPAGRSR